MANIDLWFIVYHQLLWQAVLGCGVREKGAPHNCLDDACAAMNLVLAKIKHGVDREFPISLAQEPVSWHIHLQHCIVNIIMLIGYWRSIYYCYIVLGSRKWDSKAFSSQDTNHCKHWSTA